MANFRAIARAGGSANVSRQGSAASSENNGWDIGVRVEAYRDGKGRDVFEVFATGGSHKRRRAQKIGTLTLVDDAPKFEVAYDCPTVAGD